MDFIEINEMNIEKEHICCAIGSDKINSSRAETKKEWMKARLKEGLIFRRLDARGKVFIEYMPIEFAWKPIIGKNYLVIHCLWVSGQFQKQGYAKKLLDSCIEGAKKQGKDGIAVITSNKKKPYLTEKKFYQKHGFETCDTAEPYFELMVLKLNPNAPTPEFSKNAKQGIWEKDSKGYTLVYSNQCPFMEEYVGIMEGVLKSKTLPYQTIKLNSAKDAQKISAGFGTFSLYLNGKLLTHELMPEEKFKKFIESI